MNKKPAIRLPRFTEPGVTNRANLARESERIDKAPGLFRGFALVHDGRVLCCIDQDRRGHAVASICCCYDTLGRLRWSREVCDAPEFVEYGNGRARQHLLDAGGRANRLRKPCRRDCRGRCMDWAADPGGALSEPDDAELEPARAIDAHAFMRMAAYVGAARFRSAAVSTRSRGRSTGKRKGPTWCICWQLPRSRLRDDAIRGAALCVSSGRTEWMQPSDGRLPSLGGLWRASLMYWPTQDPQLPYRVVSMQTGCRHRSVGIPHAAGGQLRARGCLAIAGMSELFYLPARLAPLDLRPQASHRSVFSGRTGELSDFAVGDRQRVTGGRIMR